jgi:hypothetical protein
MKNDRYVNIKRIKKLAHCGEVNIPRGNSFIVDEEGFITLVDNPEIQICWDCSNTAYEYFGYNNDDKGFERKELINKMRDMMAGIRHKDVEFADFLEDVIAMKYKKHPEVKTDWDWDYYKVHTAPMYDLQYLYKMISVMKKRDDENVRKEKEARKKENIN